jgi:hypothetical protein
MATRYAVATGNYSNTAIWDNGAVPTSADDVYANNFTVTIDGTYTAQSIRNTATNTLVPNIATPAMTSNNTPSGTAFASSANGANAAWNAFSQDGFTTIWQCTTANTGILGYQFPTGKVIKRYHIKGYSINAAGNPSTWTFQGSNDGTTYTTLETVTAFSMPTSGTYTSGVLANTTSYTYYRINILAVQTLGNAPYVSELEMTESTGTVFGGVASGQFIYANGGNLTTTATTGIIVGSTTPTLEMTLASPNTAIFNGSVLALTNTYNYISIRHSSTGTLNLNGTYAIDNGTVLRTLIAVTSTGILNIIGDISSTVTAATNSTNTILMNTAGTINITGNVTASTNSAILSCPISVSGGNLNITGNVSASVTPAVYLPGAVTYTQTGIVTASTVQPAIYNLTSAATISIIGTINAGTGSPAIYSSFALSSGYSSGTYVKVSGNVVNSTNNMAIVAPRVIIDTNTSSWLFQISTGGNRTLYAAGVALGNPAIANVRFGTTYGASSELTGTLRVPTAANVLSGVLVDNTTGTLLMTPADFWNYLIASGFTANSIGDRLQNAATVASTGGQIASYNI